MTEKLWISPLSSQIITAAANVCNRETSNPIGLIISENQVSKEGGYTNHTNETLLESLGAFKRPPLVSRDHSSCIYKNLEYDCRTLNGLHLDPFKNHLNDPQSVTLSALDVCDSLNKQLFYEVGTEEAVMTYNAAYLSKFLYFLVANLQERAFDKIRYVVVQCGTKLHNGKNVLTPDDGMLKAMWDTCRQHQRQMKVHNADFISNKIILRQAQLADGNIAYNICPEIGFVESSVIWDNSDDKTKTKLLAAVTQHKYIGRWFDIDYHFTDNKKTVVCNMLHYLYNSQMVRDLAGPLTKLIVEHLEEFLYHKISACRGKNA